MRRGRNRLAGTAKVGLVGFALVRLGAIAFSGYRLIT